MARYAMEPPLDRIPWILDMVDVDSEKWATLGQGRGPTAAIYRREGRVLREFERRAIRVASATTVVSERERVLLSSVAPDVPCQVVPNGIDVSAFSCAAPPSASRSVIFCGVFNYGPNEAGAVWLATAVWPLVQREIPEARLWLVGMHPTPAVQRLAADGSITVTGAVDAVQPFLWASAVAAAPLLMARGVQNKVLEALAAGLPCVVTPQVMEGLPEVVRAGCVMAVDAPAFAQALVTLLRLPPSERRAIAGRAELDALSWEAQLAPILDLLAAAAGRSGEHAHA